MVSTRFIINLYGSTVGIHGFIISLMEVLWDTGFIINLYGS